MWRKIFLISTILIQILKCDESNNLNYHKKLITPKLLINRTSTFLVIQDHKLKIHENTKILTRTNNCKFYLGDSESDADKVLSLTICENRFYGVISIDRNQYDVNPSKVGHRMTKSEVMSDRKVSLDFPGDGSSGILYRNLTGDTFFDVQDFGNDSTLADFDIPMSDQQISTSTELWLEISVAADKTLIDFHGADKVEEYIMALMNVVSAIFKHPSLSSDLGLAITKLSLYPHEQDGPVFIGQAKRSLDAVNRWNYAVHQSLPWGYGPDVALWLTRAAIGGPAGYAPVSGVCDPRRSCALNRDEGFASAFIIAHEMAHLLGLTHDGDVYSGNSCIEESQKGSVMASTVQSTFTRYLWSRCSREEFYWKTRYWPCLSNRPLMSFIEVQPDIPKSYSMNEQCRIEFGDGHTVCKTIGPADVCKSLWCVHHSKPDLCKTRKNPPLDGTQCGHRLGCYNGLCTTPGESNLRPAVPIDGAWGQWSVWSPCSKECDWGFSYRTRLCDNPIPKNGGRNCFGDGQEFKKCRLRSCTENEIQKYHIDMRLQQCVAVQKQQQDNDEITNMKWRPYEQEQDALKCSLFCVDGTSGEVHNLEISVLDGTPCSYENQDDICIQGRCRRFGCDGITGSGKERDSCGVCEGDGTSCHNITRSYSRVMKSDTTRFIILPKYTRTLDLELTCSDRCDYLNLPLTLLIRDRTRSRVQTIPSTPTTTSLTSSWVSDGRRKPTRTERRSAVAEGARFDLVRWENGHDFSVTSKGRLYSELVLSISAMAKPIKEVSFSVWFTYTISNEDRKLAARYRWGIRSWSQCSVTCGGGVATRDVMCRDQLRRVTVRSSDCAFASRPRTIKKACNTFSCSTHWIAGPWDSCSKEQSCGPHTKQRRRIYCVKKSRKRIKNNTSPNKTTSRLKILHPQLCPKPTLVTERPCVCQNRPWSLDMIEVFEKMFRKLSSTVQDNGAANRLTV